MRNRETLKLETALVIGAGVNGLTIAGLLARRGRRVLVLERRDVIGGLAAGEEFYPDYRTAGLLHETAAVRPAVIDALSLEEHGLELLNAPHPVLALPAAGRGFLLSHDSESAAEELVVFSARDAAQYERFRSFLDRVQPLVANVLTEVPADIMSATAGDLWSLLKNSIALRRLGKKDMFELLRIPPLCVADWLNEWFETDLLKAALAGPAIYGTFMGPRSPGSAFNLLCSECLTRRPVKGGPAALVSALASAAGANGVEIRTDATVTQIRIGPDGVEGVVLSDGQRIDSSIIAASCDPKHTFLDLLPAGSIAHSLEQHIRAYRMRGTTAKMHLALSGPLEFSCRNEEQIVRARTGEHLDALESAFDAVKYRNFSDTPVLDIYVPTAEDPSLAPAGHSVASILVHFVPVDLEGGWNDQKCNELSDIVFKVLERYAPKIRQCIVGSELLTPLDIQRRYGVSGGHIYHGEHALDQLLVRPAPQCMHYGTPIRGLFLCGSGSHPGGGISCAPGMIAAGVVARGS